MREGKRHYRSFASKLKSKVNRYALRVWASSSSSCMILVFFVSFLMLAPRTTLQQQQSSIEECRGEAAEKEERERETGRQADRHTDIYLILTPMVYGALNLKYLSLSSSASSPSSPAPLRAKLAGCCYGPTSSGSD